MEGFRWGAESVSSVADQLNMRQIKEELTYGEESEAELNNLLIVFANSDDMIQLRGAINDEILPCDCIHIFGREIVPEWLLPDDKEPSAVIGCRLTDCFRFTCLSGIESKTFYTYIGMDLYCVGVVIDLGQLQENN